jgi:hypothetical protein
MAEMNESVSVPEHAGKLSDALAKFVLDIIAAKKSGASGVALVAAIGSAAISDLGGALDDVTNIGGEIGSEPIGVAEAFSIAGFKVARSLSGK